MRVIVYPPHSTLGGRDNQQDASDQHVQRGFAVCVVADGVGSRPDGYACASMVASTAVSYLSVFPRRRRSAADFIAQLIPSLERRLADAVLANELHPHAATTLAAAVVERSTCWAITVGDSRVTLVRDHTAIETTEPHTRAIDRRRELAPPRADDDTSRGELARWVSAEPESARTGPTTQCWPLAPGDLVALTTDGIHDVLPLWRLAEVAAAAVAQHGDPAEAILIETTHGMSAAADNGTVACLQVEAHRAVPR